MQSNLKLCWIYHKFREARRSVRFSRALLKDGNSSRDLKPFYPQFLIGRHVAVLNKNFCCLIKVRNVLTLKRQEHFEMSIYNDSWHKLTSSS